jgi:hydrogenase maturation protease
MSTRKSILVVGIGNRLMSDDGFGPRVIDILSSLKLPDEVEVRDAGTAGITIATDLEDYEVVIFIDSMEINGPAGSVSLNRLEVKDSGGNISELARTTLHEVGLEGLIRFSKAIGTLPEVVYLIGCRPKVLEPSLKLSEEVEKALERAVELVLKLLKKV